MNILREILSQWGVGKQQVEIPPLLIIFTPPLNGHMPRVTYAKHAFWTAASFSDLRRNLFDMPGSALDVIHKSPKQRVDAATEWLGHYEKKCLD